MAGCNFLVVAWDSKLVSVFIGLWSCGGDVSVCVVVGSSLFVSGGIYQFDMMVWGLGVVVGTSLYVWWWAPL